MAEDRRHPANEAPDTADRRTDASRRGFDALADELKHPASQPIATRTRVPSSFDLDEDGDAIDVTSDRDEPVDGDPIHPSTRVP